MWRVEGFPSGVAQKANILVVDRVKKKKTDGEHARERLE